MKNFFGVFSVIAILMVSFTSKANADYCPDNTVVVFDIGDVGWKAVDVVSVEVVNVEVIFASNAVDPVFYVAEGGLAVEGVPDVGGEFHILSAYTFETESMPGLMRLNCPKPVADFERPGWIVMC